jgi:glycosyltransferase involved in cell wall biosynthesis
MVNPLVSVICLCYKQGQFVREAVLSALNQTYLNVEIIIVDDASSDNSVTVIQDLVEEFPELKFIRMPQNAGNCKAFNTALKLSRGTYIIDLAADDVLLPHRIEKGVHELQKSGPAYGVNFSDAEWINEAGQLLYKHSDRFPHHTVPQGDVYEDVIQRFFICSPTVMFSREVIDHLGGYDEKLSYEDFDFWVRSSRKFQYCYTPEVLVKKRVVKKSLSARQFSLLSPHQNTTYEVCKKIMKLNKNRDEQRALSTRIKYEIRLCLRLLLFPLAWKYLTLLRENVALKFS